METEAENTENLTDIRVAIVAPDRTIGSGIPGYYFIFGKLNNKKLVFIKEVEETSAAALFRRLVADEEKYRIHTIYTYPFQAGDVLDFIRDLHDYLREKNISWIRIVSTLYFYGDDPGQGVNIIGQWADRFTIPKETTLRYQFDHINNNPEKFDDPIFYAFTALRYLLAGFKLDKNYSEQVEKNRAKALKEESRKKLTGVNRAAADELDYFFRRLDYEDDWEGGIV